MKRSKILLIGGGGHCVSVIDVIKGHSHLEVFTILDAEVKSGAEIIGYAISGTMKSLPGILSDFDMYHISIGQIKSSQARRANAACLDRYDKPAATIISPIAYTADSSYLSDGVFIGHHALLNAGAIIGRHTIVNSKALVEHNVVIGDFCHIATGALVNGDCNIGNDTFIGSGAIIKQGVNIGSNCVVGAGSVVINDVSDNTMVVGNPARVFPCY